MWRWRRKRRKRRRGKAEEAAVCRAGLLWITWSSVGLRIYSSTAAVRGSGASCMLLPQITTKQGHGVSICWIQDSAALHALLSPSACTLMLSLFPSGFLSASLLFLCLPLKQGDFIRSHKRVAMILGSQFSCFGACGHTSGALVNKMPSSIKPQPTSHSPSDDITPLSK